MVMAPIGASSATVRPVGPVGRLGAWQSSLVQAPPQASDVYRPGPQVAAQPASPYAPYQPSPYQPAPVLQGPSLAQAPAGQGILGRLFTWLKGLFQAPAPQQPYPPQPQQPYPGYPNPTAPVQPTPQQPYPTPAPAPGGVIDARSPLKASFVQAYHSTIGGMSNAQVRAANEAAARSSNQNVDRDLFAAIDSVPAGRRIDAALFDIEDPGMVAALVRAKQRGVDLRVVTDADYYWKSDKTTIREPIKQLLAAGVPIRPDDRSGLMHHKFLVLDGQQVWTGSTNVTSGGIYEENNNALLVDSPELASQFAAVFSRMYDRGEFGPSTPSDPNPAPRTVQVGSARITTYFSPGKADSQSAQEAIMRVVGSARSSVQFLAFSYTDDALGQLMIDKARQGVRVQGVFEKSQAASRYSEYQTMKAAMPALNADGHTRLDVRTDANPALMHHKVIIVDGSTLIMGSHNFSESAQSNNNENLLVIENAPDLVAQYQAEFQRIQAVSNAPGA